MIEAIRIRNYKSVVDMKIRLGQVNVFIGENGSGKSNILEAITMASGAEKGDLSKSSLVSHGVRIIDDTELMSSNFIDGKDDKDIVIDIYPTSQVGIENPKDMPRQQYSISPYIVDNSFIKFKLNKNKIIINEGQEIEIGNSELDKYFNEKKEKKEKIDLAKQTIESIREHDFDKFKEYMSVLAEDKPSDADQISKTFLSASSFDDIINNISILISDEESKEMNKYEEAKNNILAVIDDELQPLKEFVIFSPENTALRNFYKEKQIEPLGINGEGLLRTLKSLRLKHDAITDIEDALSLFGWYDSFSIPENLSDIEDKIYIKDKYLKSDFDQRSANEGFLFILFYMALIVSENTPKIFAIDNIETSLNPKLCTKLMEVITVLSKKYGKQVLLTTHNPSILDGLDLKDDTNKLFAVSRNYNGQTIIKKINKDKNFKKADGKKMKFSEAFLRGYIGGLPKGF